MPVDDGAAVAQKYARARQAQPEWAAPDRIDCFVENVARVLAPERVYYRPAQATPGEETLEEVIDYEPLGVVANISAWNPPTLWGRMCLCQRC